jgi:formylmethanofuran dehydrogenase subunit E
MKDLDDYLAEAEKNHGHMCPGQILGVRMAMLGCRLVGIDEPRVGKRIIVYVEIDRCATDAINTVTGCRLGKRTLKFRDFGKLAATFLNTETNEAVRVVALESSRDLARECFGPLETKKAQQMEAYHPLPDEKLFTWSRVSVALPESDRPGHPTSRVACEECGEGINDHREVVVDGRSICRSCAGEAYYQVLPD